MWQENCKPVLKKGGDVVISFVWQESCPKKFKQNMTLSTLKLHVIIMAVSALRLFRSFRSSWQKVCLTK